MQTPKFSIITPVFNNEKEIEQCLKSVAAQTYTNIEHIIIDGNSNDNTVNIIMDFSIKHPHLKFLSEKDNGIYDAMNKGIQMASGDYLYFMGSDDVFYNELVLSQIADETKSFDLIYGNVWFKHKQIIYNGASDKRKIIDCSICHQAAFFHKRIFDAVGVYGATLKYAGDWDLFLRCFYNEKIKIKYVDNIICIFNDLGISGYHSESKKTKYRVLYHRLGIWGVLSYWRIQLKKYL